MRRVELFELIRKDHDLGLSKNAIFRKRGVGKKTVNQALASAVPPERKKPVRVSPILNEEVKAFIDGILESDKKAPRKQRHTAKRIWQRVTDELASKAAEVTVRRYVRLRKRELAIGVQAFVPQHHPAGTQFEVDFYEALIEFVFGAVTAKIISIRSEFSGAALHVAYPAQTQSALLEGIMLGLEFLGGVPQRMRFDNLKQAVARILRGKRRVQQDRFIAFRSHYLFDASFTSAGKEGAHEKGGVENEVGRFRRRWLTPVLEVSSWEELNDYLRTCCITDLDRKIEGRTLTVGELAQIENQFLRPVAKERFEIGEVGEARVDQKARITVRTNRYSVPARLVGRKVIWRMTPLSLEVLYEGKEVALHDVIQGRAQESLKLDHYLEVLGDKPGAFPGSLPLHQARNQGEFPRDYEQLWRRLCSRQGESDGTRQMIDVLLLHRTYKRTVVASAVSEALATGSADPSMVNLFARRIAAGVQLTFERQALEVGELSRYDRPLPTTDPYDTLLEAVAK